MPTTPKGFPYPAPTDPVSSGANDIKLLAEAVDTYQAYYSSTPPASPVAGSIWDYPVFSGLVWRFRYNPSAPTSFKWEFIGGAPNFVIIDTQETTTSTTPADLTTVGPSRTIFRAGDYYLDWGCQVTMGGAGTAKLQLTKTPGGTLVPNTDMQQYIAVTNEWDEFVRYGYYFQNLAVNDVIKMQYSVSGGTGVFKQRHLGMIPIRVS